MRNEFYVTEQFRSVVIEAFGLRSEDRPLMLLLDYILFSTGYDKESGFLMVSWETCKNMKYGDSRTNNFSLKAFLEEFSERLFRIDVEEHSWHGKKTTSISKAHIPNWLDAERILLLQVPIAERKVGFVSGTPRPAQNLSSVMQLRADEARTRIKDPSIEEIFDYLHQLPDFLFQSVVDRIPLVIPKALALSEPSRSQHLALMANMSECPRPYYTPGRNSVRIFPMGGLLAMKSEIRDELAGEWVKLDLEQAQLGVIAGIWKLDWVWDFVKALPSGLWHDISSHVGVPLSRELKGAIKAAMYAVPFGGSKHKISENLSEILSRSQVKLFWSHPVISALLTRRDLRFLELRQSNELMDAFGNVIKLPKDATEKVWHEAARSALACEAQSYEVAIMSTAVHYAKATIGDESPLYVTAWLHDGIWVWTPDCGSMAGHLASLQCGIAKRSEELLGLQVRLAQPDPKVLSSDRFLN